MVFAISLAKIFKAKKITLSRKQENKRKYVEIDNAENMKTEEIIEEDKLEREESKYKAKVMDGDGVKKEKKSVLQI